MLAQLSKVDRRRLLATHDIFMPALSSTMTEGKIVEWLKQPGDKVGRGEPVLVVESDKADMDVESFQEGYLAAVLMPAGSMAPVGETIGLIVESEDEIASVRDANPIKSDSSPSKVTPQANEGETMEKSSSVNSSKGSAPKKPLPALSVPQETPPIKSVVNNGRIVASPRAKKLATQTGVDLSTVLGSGPHGRIQAEDVQRAKGEPISVPWIAESDAPASNPASENVSSPSVPKQTPPSLDSTKGKSYGAPGEVVPFNTLQKSVNRNMEASLAFPCFRVSYTITTDKFDAFYQEVKPKGITMTALLAKAIGLTLARHPQVNASYTAGSMQYPKEVNVAIAVAMEDGGLITPVLKNADITNLVELSKRWADLVKRSRAKQLQPDEYSTGTFTLSNLGMFGVDRFDAILPPGTGAILAVGSSQPTVVAGKDGSIAIKRQMQVNLTADHRVIYGADGALFLRDLASLLENEPGKLAI